MSTIKENFILSNGVKIPKLGFGTWQIANSKVTNPVSIALINGYRHIDTASAYQNEIGVGKAVAKSGIARNEIFITSKIPAEVKTYEEAKAIIDKSLENLNLDYIDLMLIHAPKPWKEMFNGSKKAYFEENIKVWRAMEEAYKAGKLKSIGVSNFQIADMQNLMDNCDIFPMVNQIMFYIGNTQDEITSFCQENNILVQGYSPIATGALLGNEIVEKMACNYGKSIPQICIRYLLQLGVLPLPKSTHEEFIIQNSQVNFVISDEDMKYLNSLKNIVKAPF